MTQSPYLAHWCGEITGHESGPGEGEVTLTVSVTAPARRTGRTIQVAVHRDLLHDLLDAAD